MPRRLSKLFMTAATLVVWVASGSDTFLQAATDTGSDFCATQRFFDAGRQQTDDTLGLCPEWGLCDQADMRNLSIPDDTTRFRLVRLYFHILRDNAGNNPACTEAQLAAQVDRLNVDYYDARFMFEYQWRWVNDSRYRSLADDEADAMKETYHAPPDSFLNVWVTFTESGFSWGTFPFDDDALTARGGIVMRQANMQTPQSILGHEIGHCFGLFHTFNGVDETEFCGPCYEPAGTLRGDSIGDRCQDTDPTPTNTNCSPPGGSDACSGNPWGDTDYLNIMGYGGWTCSRELTPQQMGRMHCWFVDRLQSWEVGVKIAATNTFGPAPLTVSFAGQSTKLVTSWSWDFGDGGAATTQDVLHEYQAGHYDVSLDIASTDGPWQAISPGIVWAHADSLRGADNYVLAGKPLRVDVAVRNYLPLTEIVIPFSWSGVFNLTFDSASTSGLRTDYAATRRLLSLNTTAKTGVYQILINSSTQPHIAPGDEAVVSLWFRVPGSIGGRQMQVAFPTVGTTSPSLRASPGTYPPTATAINLYRCVPGDVNDDLSGPDGSDLQWLVDYLFFNLAPPPFPPSGNVDGQGVIDGSDLQFLVEFIFFNSTRPSVCREPM